MPLRIGQINYANCAPFFTHLQETGFLGEIVPGVPAELNRYLADGEVDASPSSSFEYGRHWRDYLLLPGHSISSVGPARSVLLFSPKPLEALEGEEIALTGESATSVNLLQIILREFVGLRSFSVTVPDGSLEAAMSAGHPALLIGNRALKAAMNPGDLLVYDLGDLWLQYTGLPFVFALWIVRRDAAERKKGDVLRLNEALISSRRRAFASLDELAARSPERAWMGSENLIDYWRDIMSYDLGPAHMEGLRLFFNLCVRYQLLNEEPEIRFFE